MTRTPALEAYRLRLQQLGEAAQRRWKALARREQRLLTLLASLVAVLLLWFVFVEPAWTRVTRERTQIPRLQAQAASLDALLREAQALQGRAQGALATGDVAEALNLSLSQATMGGGIELTRLAGGNWRIDVSAVSADMLLQWLQETPAQVRLRADTVDLARALDAAGRAMPGRVTGHVQLVSATASGAPR